MELPIDEVRQSLWQAEKPVAVLGGGFLIIAIGFGRDRRLFVFENAETGTSSCGRTLRLRRLLDINIYSTPIRRQCGPTILKLAIP